MRNAICSIYSSAFGKLLARLARGKKWTAYISTAVTGTPLFFWLRVSLSLSSVDAHESKLHGKKAPSASPTEAIYEEERDE